MLYTHERNFGCRITEYVFHGLRTVTMENEIIRVTILADKGTDIIEFLHKPTDTDYMWRSPLGIKNPALFVPTNAHPNGAFLDYYEGGWQEIMPAGGDACEYQGVSFGIHGEVSLIPWEYSIVENRPERIVVKFSVRTYRTPFYLEKTLSMDRNSGVLSFYEELHNEGYVPMELMWGHHPAFGPPFLDGSCVLDLASAKVLTRDHGETSRTISGDDFDWPIVRGKNDELVDLSLIPPPEAKSTDWACLYELEEGWYALTNQNKRVGFGLVWPKEIFPYIWYWQCAGGWLKQPFYGRVYTISVEPWTTFPDNLALAAEQGTTLRLAAGESVSVEFKAIAYSGIKRVAMLTPSGEVVPRQASQT